MARLAWLAAVLLLAGCEASTRPPVAVAPRPPVSAAPRPVPSLAATTAPEACAGGAESMPVTTDRGIGGTGIGGGTALADRGIGGTGIFTPGTLRGVRTAERGGGGTGIVGVITGLPRLCIDGLAVAVDRPVQIAVDGTERTSETLYVGEVAAVEATGSAGHLHAVRIGIRHEVSGPITAVDQSGAAIDVAGQDVLLTPHTQVATALQPGNWVTVSGLRDPAGAIHASRVDARAPGTVEVAGVPRQVGGNWQIGGLRLLMPPKLVPGPERLVVAGDYAAGTLRVRDASIDPLVPAGNGRRRLLVEGYPSVADNQVWLANGLAADVGPAFGAAPPADQPIILELVSKPDGALMAVSWRGARSGGAEHGKAPPQPSPPPSPQDPTAVPASPSPGSLLQSPATTTTAAASATVPATTSVAATTPASTSSTPGAASDAAGPPASRSPAGSGNGNNGSSAVSGGGSSAPGGGGGGGAPAGPAVTAARSPPPSVGEGHRGAAGAAPGGGAEGGKDGLSRGAGIGTATSSSTSAIGSGPTSATAGAPAAAGRPSGGMGGTSPAGATPAAPGAPATGAAGAVGRGRP